jgi:hypothetical protein
VFNLDHFFIIIGPHVFLLIQALFLSCSSLGITIAKSFDGLMVFD